MRLLDSSGARHRLDVELSLLEFEVHPYMTLEHQLVSKRAPGWKCHLVLMQQAGVG